MQESSRKAERSDLEHAKVFRARRLCFFRADHAIMRREVSSVSANASTGLSLAKSWFYGAAGIRFFPSSRSAAFFQTSSSTSRPAWSFVNLPLLPVPFSASVLWDLVPQQCTVKARIPGPATIMNILMLIFEVPMHFEVHRGIHGRRRR